MKITKAVITRLEVPLKEPFVIAYDTYHTMPSIVLALETDDGLLGYGESVPDPHVTGETPGGAVDVLRHVLLPAILGLDPRDITEVHRRMDAAILGNGSAKAAVDIACWDLSGKAAGLPVYSLLGGRKKADPFIARVMSILAPEVLAEQAVQARAEGFTHLKMKLGGRDGRDVDRVRAVREAVGHDLAIRVDANQGWDDPATAIAMIRALEPFGIDWVEQPIRADDVDGFALIRAQVGARLMADEAVVTQGDLARFVRARSVDMVNLKLQKSGGIRACHRLATQAELAGFTVQIGSMLETSIASAAGYHLALAHPAIVSTELSGPVKFSKEPGNLEFRIPEVLVSTRPGLGVDVDQDVLDELTVDRWEIGA